MKDNGHPVAIKFIPQEAKQKADKEFAIFERLNAIENEQTEKIGIPTVYYRGKWKNFILIAITLLDQDLEDIKNTTYILPLDTMILFRNFVSSDQFR